MFDCEIAPPRKNFQYTVVVPVLMGLNTHVWLRKDHPFPLVRVPKLLNQIAGSLFAARLYVVYHKLRPGVGALLVVGTGCRTPSQDNCE